MRTITIEIPEEGDEHGLFDVVLPDGRRCNGLVFDEMLGQVVALTHKQLGYEQYAMKTPERWEADREARQARINQIVEES